jgi:hypothetical protein
MTEQEHEAEPQIEESVTENATDVAVVQKAALEVGTQGYIVPKTVEEAMRLAKAVVVAGLAPDSYKNDPSKIVLGIMAGIEAGLPPLYGLRQIAIINGRPSIWGDAAMALVQSKNLIDEYSEVEVGTKPTTDDLSKWPDDYGFEVRIKRRHQKGEYVGLFTVGMAKRAKLWLNHKKTPWLEHPLRMLKVRARAFPLRDGFADALAGLAIREEMEDTFGEEEATKYVAVNMSDEPTVEVPPMPGEEEREEA